jgi:hypothetical protein
MDKEEWGIIRTTRRPAFSSVPRSIIQGVNPTIVNARGLRVVTPPSPPASLSIQNSQPHKARFIRPPRERPDQNIVLPFTSRIINPRPPHFTRRSQLPDPIMHDTQEMVKQWMQIFLQALNCLKSLHAENVEQTSTIDVLKSLYNDLMDRFKICKQFGIYKDHLLTPERI